MNNLLFNQNTEDFVRFYIILDTNHLMDSFEVYDKEYANVPDKSGFPEIRFPMLWAPTRNPISFLLRFLEDGKRLLLPTAIVLPTQVKDEISKLHRERSDLAKTANAKKNIAQLQRYYRKDVAKYMRVGFRDIDYYNGMIYKNGIRPRYSRNPYFEDMSSRLKGELFTFHEIDLQTIPATQVCEVAIGPDSKVDKGIISLARYICGRHPHNHCFIATSDTGIQAEISHLFHRQNMNIGCSLFLGEYWQRIDDAAKMIVKDGGGYGFYKY